MIDLQGIVLIAGIVIPTLLFVAYVAYDQKKDIKKVNPKTH